MTQKEPQMTDDDLTALPAPTFAGGTTAITRTPVVGTPRREYAEAFVPGEEELEDGELRVAVLGSGNPWVTPEANPPSRPLPPLVSARATRRIPRSPADVLRVGCRRGTLRLGR